MSETYERSTESLSLLLVEQREQCLAHGNSSAEANRSAAAGCPVDWHTVQCWPATPAGSLALMPCLDELHGIRYDTSNYVMRWCFRNGSWANFSDYSRCEEIVADWSDKDSDIVTVYAVGFCLSLAAVSVAVIIFLYFNDLKCLRNTIHTNLMFTYIFYDAAWILNLYVQGYTFYLGIGIRTVLCGILITTINYFCLTNFFWMFVEGLYLFMLVVVTFTGERVKLRVYAMIGWGLPGVILVAWAIAKHLAKPTDEFREDPLMKHCPSIAVSNFDWIHIAPVIAILAVNLVFLVCIMWVLITKLKSTITTETQQYLKGTKALVVLFPLLGITYILTLLGPMEGVAGAIFTNVRALFVSLQGFSVALFFCFLNGEVQNALRHRVVRWRQVRALCRQRRKPWTPPSNTEITRIGNLLYDSAVFGNSGSPYLKRGSTASAATTTTLVGPMGGTCSVDNLRLSNCTRATACPLMSAGEDAV